MTNTTSPKFAGYETRYVIGGDYQSGYTVYERKTDKVISTHKTQIEAVQAAHILEPRS